MNTRVFGVAVLLALANATAKAEDVVSDPSALLPAVHEHDAKRGAGAKQQAVHVPADRNGEHPAIVVKRQLARQGYDYGAKSYSHPSGAAFPGWVVSS